jgi:hypothetical protein
MVDLNALTDRLEKIVFRLDLGLQWNQGSLVRHYGTGFFLDRSGVALTAYHNLPDAVKADPTIPIQADFRGQTINLYWKLTQAAEEEWQKKLDVAILQGPDGAIQRSELIQLVYLPLAFDRRGRALADARATDFKSRSCSVARPLARAGDGALSYCCSLNTHASLVTVMGT